MGNYDDVRSIGRTEKGADDGRFGSIFIHVSDWIAVSIFYTTVVWRAMRAHERLADAHERLAKAVRNLGNQTQFDR